MALRIPLRWMACAALAVIPLGTLVARADDRVVWKPLENAVLKIDDKPARIWNVFHGDKKDTLLLVQLGRRFLMLDVKEKQIFEINPEKLERKGDTLLWREQDKPERPLVTSDWLIRDAGRAKRIRARLVGEGRVLEVQVPQLPDLRPLY